MYGHEPELASSCLRHEDSPHQELDVKSAWLERPLIWLLGIYGAIGLSLLAIAPKYFLPAEDAMILFSYSRNLATHGAITFFACGPRTEGATDFAWMALIAGAMRVGLDPYWFSAVVNVGALLGLAAVLLRIARVRVSTLRVLAIAGSAALFPQIFAAAAGFAVLPDAFLLTTVTLLVIERRVAWASLAALVFCLFRPDGVVFMLPLLAYTVISSKQKRAESMKVTAFFLVPGLSYFAWRAHYFGELFPLPFDGWMFCVGAHSDLRIEADGHARAPTPDACQVLLLIFGLQGDAMIFADVAVEFGQALETVAPFLVFENEGQGGPLPAHLF